MRTFSLADGAAYKEERYKSLTYSVKGSHIAGYADGIEAVKQAVDKILSTERFAYPVYSFFYGIELKKLIGKEQPYVRAELKRMVAEALLQDDRIKGTEDFDLSFEGDICRCSFSVHSIYGNITANMEVTV